MKFNLSIEDVKALEAKDISFDSNKDYSEDEAFELSDDIRDVEIFFAQNEDLESLILANKYAMIADEIDRQIDENESK